MRTALLIPLFCLATPAFAGTFMPPEGCTANLTVQSRGCLVSHFYTCEKDPNGDQWRADYDDNGPFFLSHIDSEAQWLESYESDPMVKETLDPSPKDPASFQTLLDTGLDTFTFALTKESGEKTNVTGFDRLNGKNVVIDGVTLLQTEFEYTQTDETGNVLRHARGLEYISPEWRTFFSGQSEWESEDGSWTAINGAPVSFILPGEPGFAATTPIFECNAQMSMLQ